MRTFNMQQYRSHSMYKLHTYECKNFFKANNDKNKEIFVPPTVSGKKTNEKSQFAYLSVRYVSNDGHQFVSMHATDVLQTIVREKRIPNK